MALFAIIWKFVRERLEFPNMHTPVGRHGVWKEAYTCMV